MRLPAATAAAGADPRLAEAARALESLLVRQIVKSSGAFTGGASPGAGVRADLFADALADAVVRAGGLGIAGQVTATLAPGAAPSATPLPPAPLPTPGAWARPGAERSGFAASPVEGRVTSRFGPRSDPFTGEPALHAGIDVGAPEGTPIRSPADGVVVRVGPRGGYGQAVEIDHGNGLVGLYAHTSEVLVAAGDSVAAGTEIAKVGHSGRATGSHLHFELRQGGRPVDPSRALNLYARRADERAVGADLTDRRSP